jgi:hypothetical protein
VKYLQSYQAMFGGTPGTDIWPRRDRICLLQSWE